MLDPKIANMVSRELEKDSIVVFDEAHNIDNICLESLSVTLDKRTLIAAGSNLRKLNAALQHTERTNARRLEEEYKVCSFAFPWVNFFLFLILFVD
jgi:DNA excision repair protein ERCC-2